MLFVLTVNILSPTDSIGCCAATLPGDINLINLASST
jgi:hypothetical protein